MNDNSNNKYISKKFLPKYNSLKLENKYNNKIIDLQGYHKAFTYNKSSNASQSFSNIKTIIKNNDLNFVKIKNIPEIRNIEKINPNKIDSSDFNSKQKIIDTSSVSLLNATNPHPNRIIISSSYNDIDNKETPQLNVEKMVGLNVFSKLNTKIQDSTKIEPRKKISFKKFNKPLLMKNIHPIKNDKKENKITDITLKNIERRKSHQPIIFNNEKYVNGKNKNRKSKNRKTGAFLKLHENKEDRHLSLFSKRSVINSSNSIIQNEKMRDFNSQNIRKTFIEQYKKNSPVSLMLKGDKKGKVQNLKQKV